MKKLLLSSLLIFAILGVYGQQHWVSFNGQAQGKPDIRVIEKSGTKSMTLEINIPGMYVEDVQQEGKTFQRLEIMEMQSTKEIGRAELPMISKIVGLPGNTIARLTILEQEESTLENYLVYPFQTPTKDIKKAKKAGFDYDKAFYASTGSFPGNNLYVEKPQEWRDVRVSGIHYVPLLYNAAAKQLTVTTRIRIRVDFEADNNQAAITRSKSVKPTFFKLYKSSLLNFDMMGLTESLSSADTNVRYLIITNDGAVPALANFIQWKNEQGFRVEVKILEPGFNQPQEFKNYIQQLYDNEDLEYVLMVGDAYPNGGSGGGPNIVPMFWWAPGGEDPSYSDSWYTCLDGVDDHYADLAIGRFTYDNIGELEGQIVKTMAHYFNPDTTSNWAEHTLLVAHEENFPQKYTQCKEEIRTYSYPLQTPLFQTCYGGAGAGNADIVNFVNNTSCGIFNYRGHGSTTEFWEWGATGSFTSTHVDQLTNINKCFVLFDVCCDNMDIVDFPGNCLCESFMKSAVASVAINGAIIPSYTIPNHDYDKEMYKAVFEEGIYNIGYVTNFANITVLNVHGTIGRSNVRTYLWLGDASLEPWTKKAMVLNVSHAPELLQGSTSMQVVVNGQTGPLEDAMVCISNANGTIYGVAFSDASGIANVQFASPVLASGTAKVTVTKHNYLPYQGNIALIQMTGPYVIKDSQSINDTLANNNGLLDYGESVKMTLGMKNVGISTASNVNVTISSASPYVTITDNNEAYGNIAANTIKSVPSGFAFQVANNVPNGYLILFALTATDGTSSWNSSFSVQAHAPVLNLGNVTVLDPAGNNNGKIDAGETVNLVVEVKNTGSADASVVIGNLLTTDTYITINSSTQTYGPVAPGAVSQQNFSITASGATPAGHTANFNVNFSANLGISGTGTFNKVVGQIPILIVNFDPNNSSAPAMITAINSLGLSAELLTTLPADLGLYNTIFVCLGVYSNNHPLTSAEGTQLAAYLGGGGRLYMEGGDTWCYDAQTAVHPMFNIQPDGDGSSDLAMVLGFPGTFTEGMLFTYTGENNYIDRIIPVNNAFPILQNAPTTYYTGIAYDGPGYKTIGCSHEFAGFGDDAFPSNKQELMHQYLIFFGLLSDVLSANFSSVNPSVCQGSSVSFLDFSSGAPTSWSWSFPGGNPSNSTLQNPVVSYATAGNYNVTLTVTDGVDTNTIVKNNYVHVVTQLPAIGGISAPTTLCQGSPSTYITTPGLPDAISYQWTLSPPNAGTISGNGQNATIYWNGTFSGTAQVTVAGINACGPGLQSNPLTINTVPLPNVTMNQFAPVCLNAPPFMLTGGIPLGGIYTGEGVFNGQFLPYLAGAGWRYITYTFTDNNGCMNAATQGIYVDNCTAISEADNAGNIQVFPNPTEGKFSIEASGLHNGIVNIRIVNALGEVAFEVNKASEKGKLKLDIDGSGFDKGIYFVILNTSGGTRSLKVVIQD
jgi:PKD repeat protein